MTNFNLEAALKAALDTDERVWADETRNELNKSKLLDLLEKTDHEIISALFKQPETQRHFFVQIGEAWVFKMQDFRFFLDKHSVNNSYTRYANRIGLTDGTRFLKDSSDVVLDFPFKDCVLNGGQSTEEGEEIYFERNKDAQLSSAQLSSAQLSSAQLSSAQLSSAQLSSAQYYTLKRLANVKKFSSIKF